MAFTVKPYGSYTSQFDNPYKFRKGRVNSDVSDLLLKRLQEMQASRTNLISNRSMLDRGLDVLMTGNYASAGFADGLINKHSFSTALSQAGQGIGAGLDIFGNGDTSGEYTYSRVMENAGWKPQSLLGKIAKGTFGFVGDVLLDPTTYMTFGGSALLKGTGRVAKALESVGKVTDKLPELMHANTVDRLVNKGVSPERALHFADKKKADYATQYQGATHMTEDMAKHIVERKSYDHGFNLTDKEMTSDAKKFANAFNKQIGIRDVNGAGKGITFGIENLPFGDKIAPKLGVFGKTLDLGGAEQIRAISDKLKISHAYSGLRDNIYGRKMGELLSTNAPLYRLAQKNPVELYSFVKFLETTKGQAGDKLAQEKAIRDRAKAMDFTPDESKQVMNLLEDKTIWGKVKNTLQFAETEKAKTLKTAIEDAKSTTKSDIQEILDHKDIAETYRYLAEKDLGVEHSMYKDLQNSFRDKAVKVDLNLVEDKKLKQKLIDSIKSESHVLDQEIEAMKNTHGVDTKQFDSLVKLAEEERVKFDEHRKIVDHLNTLKQPNAKVEKGNIVKDNKQVGDKVETVQDVINKSVDNEVFKMNTESTGMIHNEKLINELSTYVYGVKGKLLHSLRGKSITDLVDKIKKGDSPDDLAYYIEQNASVYSEHATEVYSYLAGKLYYGSYVKKGEKPNWENVFKKPMQELQDKLKAREAWTPLEEQKYLKLQTLNARRRGGIDKYFKHMTYDEFKKVRLDEANANTVNELRDILDMDLNKKRSEFANSGDIGRNVNAGKPSEIIGEKVHGGKTYSVFEVEIQLSKGTIKKKRYYDSTTGQVYRLDRGRLLETSNKEFVPSEGRKVADLLVNDTKAQMFDDAILHFVNAQNRRTAKQIPSQNPNGQLLGDYTSSMRTANDIQPYQMEFLTKITNHMNDLLKENFPGKTYQDLLRGQKAYLYNMGLQKAMGNEVKLPDNVIQAMAQEARKRDSTARLEAVVDTTKEGMAITWHDGSRPREGTVTKVTSTENGTLYDTVIKGQTHQVYARDVKLVRTLDKKRMSPEEILKSSRVAQDALSEQVQLAEKLKVAQGELSALDATHAQSRKELVDMYQARADKMKETMRGFEEEHAKWDTTFRELNDGRLEKLQTALKRYNDALVSDEALTTFANIHADAWLKQPSGTYVAEALHEANVTNSARIGLDNITDNEKVKQWVKSLREEFNKMGEKEKDMGKLTDAQFNAWVDGYLPHILSADGKIHFDKLKELQPHKAGLTQDLGYGVVWNPFSASRTIEGKTLEEINQHFQPLLKGKNLFVDNLSDIYLTRALTHNNLVYDDLYMNTMMDTFGTAMTNQRTVREGFKAVVNYGQLKEVIKNMVQGDMALAKHRGMEPSKELWDKYTASNLAKLDLPTNALDDLRTPMIELTSSQMEKIQPYGVVKEVNSAIVGKANQARKLQIARDQKWYLQMYDKFLHWSKLMQTTVMPSFHMRNKMSNMYLNWLGTGRDAFDFSKGGMQSSAWKAVMHQGDTEKLKGMVVTSNDGTKVWHWDELYALAKQHGVVDEGFFARDIGAGNASKGLIKPLPRKLDPTDSENFVLFQQGSKWGSRIENSDRLLHFVSQLKQGKNVDEASASVEKYLFDYSDLTAFEQHTMKRIFPYYTWLRKNGRLQVSEMIEQPGKYRDTNKAMNWVNGMNNEEDRLQDGSMADYARDWMQLPFTSTTIDANGVETKRPIILNPNLPFMDISRLPNPLEGTRSLGGAIDETLGLLAQTAPLIKVPLELASNTNFFFNDQIKNKTEDPITPRLKHVLSQMSLFSAGQGIASKTGGDLGRHVLNNLTGVKALAYDEQRNKNMLMQQYYGRGGDKPNAIQRLLQIIGSGTSDSRSFKTPFSSPYEQDQALVEQLKQKMMDGTLTDAEKKKYSKFLNGYHDTINQEAYQHLIDMGAIDKGK